MVLWQRTEVALSVAAALVAVAAVAFVTMVVAVVALLLLLLLLFLLLASKASCQNLHLSLGATAAAALRALMR